MKFTKAKDPIFLLLLVVVIILWGVIITKVINYFTSNDEQEIEIIDEQINSSLFSKRSNAESEANIEYVKLNRDPFVLNPIRNVIKKVVKKEEPEKPKEYLNFLVNGVLINNKSKTVLIQDQTNNQTVFLKEGDEYKSIKIVSISPSEIKIKENNEVRTVYISRL